MNFNAIRISGAHFHVPRKFFLVMRITTVLLLISVLTVSAASYAQKITLNEKRASLKDVLAKIRQQSGYDFIYSNDMLDAAGPVSVKVSNVALEDALKASLADQQLTYDIQDGTVIIKVKEKTVVDKVKAVLAAIDVTGRVTDSTGTPLIGATVVIKGSSASITNNQGEFTIKAQPEEQVTVTFIGYQPYTFVVTNNLPFQNIVLHASFNKLSEVIVSSGYEQLNKSHTTGSYAELNKALLERSVSTDIIPRLNGITPALVFDNRATDRQNLSIRGRSTILSDNAPLIVLDNFPYDGDLHNINPNDVESITVLKDAASAAIWGARAGNGVIVIITKRGKFNQLSRVDFNSNLTIGGKPDLFYNPAFLNSSDFIEVEKKLYAAGFYAADIGADNKPVLSPVVELLQLGTPAANAQIEKLKSYDVRDDFEKYFYRKSVLQQYSLALTGGGEKYNFYISGGYDANRANLVGNSDDRYTLNLQNSLNPFKNLSIGLGINYTATKNTSDNPGMSAINSGSGKNVLYPYAQLADANGNALSIAKDYPLSYTNNATTLGFLNWQYKPLDEINLANNVTGLKDVRLKFSLKYIIIPGFSAESIYQYQNANQTGDFLFSQDTYFTRNLINQYKQAGNQYPVPLGGILNTTRSALNSQSGRFQLNYNKLFTGLHHLTAVAGAEIRNIHALSSNNRLYGYDADLLLNQPVDYLTYFTLNPGTNSGKIPYIATQSDLTDRYVSEYINANYNYAEKYYLSASARKDASNLFGVNTNQKGIPLYSAGVGWQISKENFYHLDWLPYLKLRASYGYTGNVNKSITAYTTAGYMTSLLTGLPSAMIATPPNPDLRWEKVGTLNLGLDFETRNKRISGSLEYYTKKGTDQLGSAPLDPTTGYFIDTRYSYSINGASIRGKGIDIELNTINTRGKVKWESRILFSYALDEVTKYQYESPLSDYFSPDSPPLVGRPVLGIYSYKWAGLDHATGDPIVYLNGVPSKDYTAIATTATMNDLIYNGPAIPPYFGSVLNTISYKNFTVSANVIYKFGYYFHRSSISYSDLIYNWQGHQDFTERWQKPGDEQTTNVPSLSLSGDVNRDLAYSRSSILVEKGDNIRLQDLQVAYTLPRFKNINFPIKGLTVYGYANNLGIIWRANKHGLDPDYFYNYSAIKPVKNFSIGFRAQF
ncbi:TonB-linked SusC/RagA family outer membrane protein [Mucilaginibacter gracilis]|uniref:TonB-linked SusC/RagA family outer membrane protein n=1 Tax=Mucilaginibacter gracilis TaxID=423350 RepID=A0A495J417_9SPHI|nr:SusC/RagA family TonB-linked outer membrane protein [Mucilaginibacter gracilis]RKR83332.1 TonB-linked SusC/RagA family outer membrane protein [Mucilaginibacter gracilis]